MEISAAVCRAAEKLHYSPLKDEQTQCVTEFLKGKDVFCILPTGYGKTACFACIPVAFDIWHNKPSGESSIIVVISPLTALIKDQVTALTRRGVSSGYVDVDTEADVKSAVNKGEYNIVFMSPELQVGKFRRLLGSVVYQKRLVGLIIDEAHCVIKW